MRIARLKEVNTSLDIKAQGTKEKWVARFKEANILVE